MPQSDRLFAGSIPHFYDELMVPMLFEAYAMDMAQRVAALSPSSLLETAAGSGAVTRVLAPLLPADARYVVSDLNQAMLDHAAARQGPDARIEWRQADALALPFEDHRFDAVCCQFGAMFFSDPVAGYSEARRVLKPGGRFLFSVWDRIEQNDFAQAVHEAVASVFPDDPPMFFVRTPHGHHDTARIRDDLTRAGFSDIAIQTLEKQSRAPSAREAATAFCQGTPMRNEIEARDASLMDAATERAAQAIAQRHGAGEVLGRMQAHVITARASGQPPP